MQNFIKGTFERDKNVKDLIVYEGEKKSDILRIFEWGDKFNVSISVGTAGDDTYICDYYIVSETKDICNDLLKALKKMLKEVFPYVKSLWQEKGECY